MQLTYRGIQYRSNNRFAAEGDRVKIGKYRGVDLPLHHSIETRVLSPIELKYRGTRYH